jgi:hypothetical protein
MPGFDGSLPQAVFMPSGAAMSICQASRQAGRKTFALSATYRTSDSAQPILFYGWCIFAKLARNFFSVVSLRINRQTIYLDRILDDHARIFGQRFGE